MENESLDLLIPPPESQLAFWLEELYGSPGEISERQVLRHRDLSYVERLHIKGRLPQSLIYKVVLPPWDIEQDLHERVLIPSISNSPRLYLTGSWKNQSALFFEDLGTLSLLDNCNANTATLLGTELARTHRSFSYRIDELASTGIMQNLPPSTWETLGREMEAKLQEWQLLSTQTNGSTWLLELSQRLQEKFAQEALTLVHGDLYGENLLLNSGHLFIIDWSWFTSIGVALLDLATVTMQHFKNGELSLWKEEIINAYCYEYARSREEVLTLLPYAEILNRLLFLHWLVERKTRGILGTTVGPVDNLILSVARELHRQLQEQPW